MPKREASSRKSFASLLSDSAERLDPNSSAGSSREAAVPPFLEWLQDVSPTWIWTWAYLLFIQTYLAKVTTGEIDRLMLFVPPRHGKSEMTTVRYPMWRLERDPSTRIIVGAYSAALSLKFSRKMRRIAKERINLSPEQKSVEDWATDEGGGVRAVGVGGGVTGMGANLIIIDDPVKSREEANSETYRDKCYEWYTDDLLTRLEPGGAIILIMTRWHDDDLAGRILASDSGDEWTVIKLPAIAEENDPLGRKPGEALCPERYDVAALQRLARVLKSSFDALFQQRPQPAGGTIFKEEWFARRYKSMPPIVAVWTTWDTALKAGEKNDESACITMAECNDGNLYLLRVAHGRWETPQLAEFLVQQSEWLRGLYGDKYRGDYVEDKVSGTTLMQYVRRSHPQLVLIPIVVGRESKEERAHGVTPLCETLRVLLPDPVHHHLHRGPVADLLAQLMAFPVGKHDDIVDAFVYALKRFMGTLGGRKSRRSKSGGQV
jgi:predicted phage terminase large subunit-like protein